MPKDFDPTSPLRRAFLLFQQKSHIQWQCSNLGKRPEIIGDIL